VPAFGEGESEEVMKPPNPPTNQATCLFRSLLINSPTNQPAYQPVASVFVVVFLLRKKFLRGRQQQPSCEVQGGRWVAYFFGIMLL